MSTNLYYLSSLMVTPPPLLLLLLLMLPLQLPLLWQITPATLKHFKHFKRLSASKVSLDSSPQDHRRRVATATVKRKEGRKSNDGSNPCCFRGTILGFSSVTGCVLEGPMIWRVDAALLCFRRVPATSESGNAASGQSCSGSLGGGFLFLPGYEAAMRESCCILSTK